MEKRKERIPRWRRLDNAAKIFPATSNQKDTRVFRFYCELKESVQGEALQTALDAALETYPLFLSVMRKGLFWYYLESSELRPVVREEAEPPCDSLFIRDRKTLLFQVSYYKNRINLEVFHALTDGTGAICFLKELVKRYLLVSHGEEGLMDLPLEEQEITVEDQITDGFAKYYKKKPKSKEKKKPASYQLEGVKDPYGDLDILEGVVSSQALRRTAKDRGVTVTVLLSAVLLWAIREEMKANRMRPLALMVPVNLRKYYPSSSMLNFFGWIEPRYDFRQEDSLEAALRQMKEDFARELTPERVEQKMNELVALERNPFLRAVPLALKTLVLRLALKLGENGVTAIFSNLGVVTMPEEYGKYMKRFGVFTSTAKMELTVCSYQDDLVFSFTTRLLGRNVQRNFFRILGELGVPVTILEGQFPEETSSAGQSSRLFRSFTFGCLAVLVAVLAGGQLVWPDAHWGLYAAGGVASLWVMGAFGFYKRRNPLKGAIWMAAAADVGCLIWDFATGWRGWSVDYVLPAAGVAAMVLMPALSRMRRIPLRENMIYSILSAMLALIPLPLLIFGAAGQQVPSLICAGLGVLRIGQMALFRGREMREELHKKLHL